MRGRGIKTFKLLAVEPLRAAPAAAARPHGPSPRRRGGRARGVSAWQRTHASGRWRGAMRGGWIGRRPGWPGPPGLWFRKLRLA